MICAIDVREISNYQNRARCVVALHATTTQRVHAGTPRWHNDCKHASRQASAISACQPTRKRPAEDGSSSSRAKTFTTIDKETPMSENRLQDASVSEVDAVVDGAGFAGLYMLHLLRDKLNLKVRVIEAADGVGGT